MADHRSPISNVEYPGAVVDVRHLDAALEETLHRLIRLAAQMLRVPMATATLRQNDGHYLSCRWERETGFTLASSTNRSVSDLPERPRVVADARHEAPHGATAAGQHRGRAWLDIPLRDASGHVAGALCVADVHPRHWTEADVALLTDLTQFAMTKVELRVAVQAAERERREKAAILERITDGFFAFDRDWRLIYVNEEATRLLHRSRDELLRQSLWSVFVTTADLAVGAELRRAMTTQTPSKFEAFYPPSRAWFAIHAYPSPQGVSVYFQDITERKLAVDRLRETEAKYRNLVELVPVTTYQITLDGASQVTFMSHQIREILGYAPEEWMADLQLWFKLLHPDDQARMRAAVERFKTTGNPFSHEYRLIARDGRVVWIRDEATLVRDEAGRPFLWQGIMYDISQEKRVEALLAEQTRILEMIAQATPLPTVLTEVLHAIEERSEGTSFAIFLTDQTGRKLRQGVAPSLPGAYLQALDGLEIGPEATTCGAAAYRRETVTTADIAQDPLWEGYRDLALHYGLRACCSTPIVANTGHVLGTLAMYYHEPRTPDAWSRQLIDIATYLTRIAIERDRAETALGRSKERYRSVMESIQEVIFQVDRDGRWTFLNPAWTWLMGYTVEESLGQPFYDYIHAEDRAERIAEFTALIRQDRGPYRGREVRYLTKSGDVRWLEVQVWPRRDETGLVVGGSGTMRDVTERKQAAEALRQSEERFRALVQSTSDIVGIMDPAGQITYLSPAVERILGHSPGDLLGLAYRALIHPDDHVKLEQALHNTARRSGARERFEFRLRHHNGSWRYLEAIVSNQGELPSVRGLVFNIRDITDRKQFEQQLEWQASRDALTGLYNRAIFIDRLNFALGRGERRGQSIAVFFLDLDHFKLVNDTFGHDAGDDLLIQASQRLRAVLRQGDTIARLGGDEFAILLDGGTSPQAVQRIGERLIETLSAPYTLDGHEVFATTSIGVAISAPGRDEATDLLRSADAALYRAKAKGKACFELFDPSMRAAAQARLEIEADLYHALSRREIELYYQPEVELSSGRIVGLEALARWNHPRHGLIDPARFIPLAEDLGLIGLIGQWILTEACRQIRDWQQRFPGGPGLVVSVNLSARQFHQRTLVEQVATALEAADLAPASLRLEITERCILDDWLSAEATLRQLEQLGVQLAIDDFGTGYASLNYLRRLSVDVLKIDRSVIRELAHDPRSRAIVGAVVELATTFGIQVVGEGIETAEEHQQVQRLGCDLGQGYHLTPPLDHRAMRDVLRTTIGAMAAMPQAAPH